MTDALVARLRTSHGQIVHEFYSKDGKLYCDCAICDAADLIERLSAIERQAKEQYHAASQADNKDPFAGRVMTELRRVLGNETPEKPGFCEDIAIAAMSNAVTSQQAEIERQGKALRAVEKELDSMDEMAKMSVPPEYHNVARWLRAALSQTEPQP